MRRGWASLAGRIVYLVMIGVLLVGTGLAFALSTQGDRGSERTWDITVATICLAPFVILPVAMTIGWWRRRRR